MRIHANSDIMYRYYSCIVVQNYSKIHHWFIYVQIRTAQINDSVASVHTPTCFNAPTCFKASWSYLLYWYADVQTWLFLTPDLTMSPTGIMLTRMMSHRHNWGQVDTTYVMTRWHNSRHIDTTVVMSTRLVSRRRNWCHVDITGITATYKSSRLHNQCHDDTTGTSHSWRQCLSVSTRQYSSHRSM